MTYGGMTPGGLAVRYQN